MKAILRWIVYFATLYINLYNNSKWLAAIEHLFGVAQRKRGGPITLRSLDRNQAPKLHVVQTTMEMICFVLKACTFLTLLLL